MLTGLQSIGFLIWLLGVDTDRPADLLSGTGFSTQTSMISKWFYFVLNKVTFTTQMLCATSPRFILIRTGSPIY